MHWTRTVHRILLSLTVAFLVLIAHIIGFARGVMYEHAAQIRIQAQVSKSVYVYMDQYFDTFADEVRALLPADPRQWPHSPKERQ